MVKDPTSGIIDASANSMKIYPNPVAKVLYLENVSDLKDVSIYTITGQMIYQSDNLSSSINVESYPSGVYTLHDNSLDGKQYVVKFMIE